MIRCFKGANYQGVSKECYEALHRRLGIEPCHPEQIEPDKWNRHDKFIFPGGECRKWDQALDDKKLMKISKWVEAGGTIVGICAGAYFLSRRSEYNSQIRHSTLPLFKGICKGPAFSENVRVVKVRWEKTSEEGYVAVIGGGLFTSYEGEVLARYREAPHENSACVVRQGNIIVSAPHWEIEASDLNGLPCPHLNEMQINLLTTVQFRARFFETIKI